jgi:23S rRNA pseudouridine955/2504/2580 synthase
MELVAGQNDNWRRLDRILRKALAGHPLSLIHRLLRQGKVLVDGVRAAPETRVQAGQLIAIDLDGMAAPRHKAPHEAGGIAVPALPVIWEGAGLLVLNKPAGLAVHGPQSLDSLVQYYLAERLSPSLSFRPGPLHRLDKPSSGLIVFSVTLEGARFFSALMRGRRLGKQYLALVEGRIGEETVWEDDLLRSTALRKTFVKGEARPAAARLSPAGAQNAVTRVYPLAAAGTYTLIRAEIETGRTHQIRAQAAARAHPLAGDRKYGGHPLGGGRDQSFLLHAWRITFPESVDAVLPRSLTAPLPAAFSRRIEELFGAKKMGEFLP